MRLIARVGAIKFAPAESASVAATKKWTPMPIIAVDPAFSFRSPAAAKRGVQGVKLADRILRDICPPPLAPRHSTLNSQLSTLNSQLSTLNSQLSTLASRLSPLASRLSPLASRHSNPPIGDAGPFDTYDVARESSERMGWAKPPENSPPDFGLPRPPRRIGTFVAVCRCRRLPIALDPPPSISIYERWLS